MADHDPALDDVARMSVKELRAAVRKERSVKARLEDVNKELSGEVLKLKLDKKVAAHTDWPDALTPVSDQVAAAGVSLLPRRWCRKPAASPSSR